MRTNQSQETSAPRSGRQRACKLLLLFLLMSAVASRSQVLMNLHNLSYGTYETNSDVLTNYDGARPVVVALSGGTLYGAAAFGGATGSGSIFSVKTNGAEFTNVYSFSTMNADSSNADGAHPHYLLESGGRLYGTAGVGGSGRNGTVFKLNIDGSSFTVLHTFTMLDANDANADGANPLGMVLVGDTLYGSAGNGGTAGNGAIFRVNIDGTGFASLHNFTIEDANYFNSDGGNPFGLTVVGTTLFGTARYGGTAGNGTIFKVNTDGTGFSTLYSFSGTNDHGLNTDGAQPYSTLVLDSGFLYGTAPSGGRAGNGTVFTLSTNGGGFTTLYSFSATNASGANNDGSFPVGGLALVGGALYGTTTFGGSFGSGTAFAITTNGLFSLLHDFSATNAVGANDDGAFPLPLVLVSAGNAIFGTTIFGGSFGSGTVFSLSLGLVNPPRLAITPSGGNVVLSWPTNAAGFSLQSTTNLAASVSWTTVSPVPVVVNGHSTLTNPISGARRFYRLSR